MNAKTKIGMSMKTKKKKLTRKRILPIAKCDILFTAIGSLWLVSGAAGVAKTINDNKVAQRQLEEMKRHNHVMEDHGVYLASYKRRRGFTTEKIKKIKKNAKQLSKLPKGVIAYNCNN